MRREERAERLVRRIESFSDLVIGFSLALLALTLTIPTHFLDLWRHPWWLIAYFWTFAIIGNLWFLHQRLFTHYFWPERLSIFLNFVLLSLVGLIVFFVQVFVRYKAEPDEVWAFLTYFFVLGLALMVMGLLYLHGTRKRWDSLDADERFVGMRHSLRGIVGAGMMIGAAASALRVPQTMNDIAPLMACIAVSAFGTRMSLRTLKQRIAEKADATG
jgi:uncharacterized membrane protein